MKDFILKLLKRPIVWVGLMLAIAIAVIAVQARILNKQKEDLLRLKANQEALLSEVEYYTSENGQLVASVNALTLRKDELENLLPSYVAEIDALKLKLKNVTTIAHVALETKADIQTPTFQLPPPPPPIPTDTSNHALPSPYQFNYEDTWITVTGTVWPDSTSNVQIECRDSLTLVAHKTKKRCCRKSKIIKYDVLTESPYSHITDLGYIELIE